MLSQLVVQPSVLGRLSFDNTFLRIWVCTFLADVTRFGLHWEKSRFPILQPSVGVGGRYISPIGTSRLDVACRLKEDPLFELEDTCRIHFAFSESY